MAQHMADKDVFSRTEKAEVCDFPASCDYYCRL